MVLHYLKAGLAAQKAGKAEEAENCFKKVIPLNTRLIRRMLCIAWEFFVIMTELIY